MCSTKETVFVVKCQEHGQQGRREKGSRALVLKDHEEGLAVAEGGGEEGSEGSNEIKVDSFSDPESTPQQRRQCKLFSL